MIKDIRKRLNRYQPTLLGDSALLNDNAQRKQAAVLLPIVNSANPSLVLTERSSQLGSHAGEVAWPGGKQDKTDSDLKMTALRESEEEIGLAPQQVEVIAELRPYISKFGLLVTPYVGLVAPDVTFVANEDEIASIFHVPLDYLLDDPRDVTNIIERHGERHIVPEYHYEGYRIWGLTSMILLEFMSHGMGMDIKHPVD
ncbi:MAG: CoA pyrophosphatase [Pseudomonadales bacterium]|nr:CoA pyrophosphatase [Pseudomonadales bacterium]MDG1442047.1 CoA pyrophosphatase [Pseudomonadales bacterium]